MPKLALVRGFGGRPLRRVVIGRGNGVFFVSSEQAESAGFAGFPPAIGAPASDVFAYSEAEYTKLRKLWKVGKTLLWESLTPFDANMGHP